MKRCAITGAAAGIGRALAERFGRAGYRITGIDVDPEGSSEATAALARRGIDASFVRADLSAPEGVEAALSGLVDQGPFDVFVHNAGINCVGAFERSEWANQRRVVELNLVAPMVLTAGLLRGGTLTGRASLVFVSSLSRFVGYPGAAGYAASKDGLAAYARSLRAAVHSQGKHVLTVYPGPTRTAHARRYSPEGSREERRMAPEELAERILWAVEVRKRVLVPGMGNRFFAVLGHALPRVTERVMRRAILDRLEGEPRGG